MWLILFVAGCGTKYDWVAHGGGTIRVQVEPVEATGITVDETFPGATMEELQLIADGFVDAAEEGHGLLVETFPRGDGVRDAYLSLFGSATVSAGDCTLDSLGVLGGYGQRLEIIIDDDDGPHTTYLQTIPLNMALGPAGSASAVVAFQVENFHGNPEFAACWGRDSIDHNVEIEWAFDESVEWVEKIPWDPDFPY